MAHEQVLRKHDEIIGNSFKPAKGIKIFKPLINRLNTEKIKAVKKQQVEKYISELQEIFTKRWFYQVEIPESDRGNLHVYPLGFNLRPKKNLEDWLEAAGITVWFKFTDSPWSKNKGVLFLPLGFHMDENKIKLIARRLEKYTAV